MTAQRNDNEAAGLSTHTTLITGASAGIGRATAEQLAAAGHKVIGMARRPVSDFPGIYMEVDLANEAATAQALEQVLAAHKVDGLVNNVGLVRPAPLTELTLTDLREVYDLNVRCTVQCSQAVVPGMIAGGYGRIVNIASLVTNGVPNRTSYAAARCAMVSCATSWALELADKGITVNAVSPGPTATELFNRNNPPGSEGYVRYSNMVPMGRIAPPEEVAVAVCFFMAESASFITGQNLFVDGGASVGPKP